MKRVLILWPPPQRPSCIEQVVQLENPGPLTGHLVGWDGGNGQQQPPQMSLAPGDGLRVAQQHHAGLPGGLWGPQQQAITAGPLQQDGIHADTQPRLLGRVPETQEFFQS